MWGLSLFVFGPNALMLATRLEPNPGFFWQVVGCLSSAFISWVGGNIAWTAYRKIRKEWDKE